MTPRPILWPPGKKPSAARQPNAKEPYANIGLDGVGAARRILVAGPSGSGKTTLAARLGEILDIPHTEIDALFHGPGWEPRPSFESDVDAFMARGAWTTEWQYSQVRERLLASADLVLWLNYPRWVVMPRVIKRTIRRSVTRQELWNGNVEPPLHRIFTDDEHIIRWAWNVIPRYREKLAVVRETQPDKPLIVFTRPRQLARFIRQLESRLPASTGAP